MTPNTARKIHLVLLAAWIFVGVPVSMLWRDSIAWVGHASAWSAERPTEVVDA